MVFVSTILMTQKPFTPQLLTPLNTSEEIVLENRISILHQLLSPSDCKTLIESLENLGLELSSTQINYRSNHRRRIKSPDLSLQIFSKIGKFLEPIVLTEEDDQQTGHGFKLHGIWEPSYLASDWVFSKYITGTHFGPHYDSPTVINFGERSLQTIIIYLSDNFLGGATNFFDDIKQAPDPKDNNIFMGDRDNVIKTISPTQGSGLLFHHHLLHEGEVIKEGYKYILRSDIVYKRTQFPEEIQPVQRDAIDWMIKAQQLEFDKSYSEATLCYRKAYRLWPELEDIKCEI